LSRFTEATPLLFRRQPSTTFGYSSFSPAVARMFLHFMPLLARIIAGAVLTVWIAAEFQKRLNRRLLDRQTSLDSIRAITWQEFEQLVAEAYRRQGYLAEVVGTTYGDGGVAIRLRRRDELALVQCKQWRSYSVSVTVIREMLGVVVSERATRGIVITSGRFTQEARRFGESNPMIQLIDRRDLSGLINTVKTNATKGARPIAASASPMTAPAAQPPPCPSCGSKMVIRIARKGSNTGSSFWGCPRYPACRGIRRCSFATDSA
jgi:restriction system protein